MSLAKTKKKIHILLDPNKWDDISRQVPLVSATYLVDLLLKNFQAVLAESQIDFSELYLEASKQTKLELDEDANSRHSNT